MSAKEAAKIAGIKYTTFLKQAKRLKLGRTCGRRYEISEAELSEYQRATDFEGLFTCEQVGQVMKLTAGQVGRYARDIGMKPRPFGGGTGQYLFTQADIEVMHLAREQALELEQERRANNEALARGRARANRAKQHAALTEDAENWDYYGRLRAFEIVALASADPALSSSIGGPQMLTLQYAPFYVKDELDKDDTNTHVWKANQDWVWESYDELKELNDGNDWI